MPVHRQSILPSAKTARVASFHPVNRTLEAAAFRLAPTITARWFVRSRPWAITLEAYRLMVEITAAHEAGIRRSREEIEERIVAAGGRRAHAPTDSPNYEDDPQHGDETPTGSKVAVIELRGVLVRHANWMTEYSGGTSTSAFAHCIHAAGADANVKGILIFADTPGGTIDGMQEAAEAVAQVVAMGKPVVVYAEHQLCSAGYGIGSQALKIVAAKRAMVGSLGVIMEHEDVSGADKQAGYAYTYVTYPKGGNKAEGNPHEPLAPETLKHYQDQIDPAGDAFYQLIAEGRHVTLSQVNKWGEGRSYDSDNALALGLVDQIGTFEDALALLDELSGGDAPAGQEDQTMSTDTTADAIRKAVADALPDALAAALAKPEVLASALGPLEGKLSALGEEVAALATKQETSAKDVLRGQMVALVDRCVDDGQIPVDEAEAEVQELMELSPESRDKRVARLKARPRKVPTKARAFEQSGDANGLAAAPDAFAGMNVDDLELAAIAKAKAEGLDPAKDLAAYAARVTALMAEGEADA